jgi:hypothetical protein
MPERTDRRRSARQDVKIQVVLRSTDEGGRDFFDRSEVISVDRNTRHGQSYTDAGNACLGYRTV